MIKSIKVTENFYITLYEQWSWFFKSCNWHDITIIQIEFEWDKYLSSFELIFCILGLGINFQYIYNIEERKKYIEKISEIE